MFDEFRIAACIYTITVGDRTKKSGYVSAEAYWPYTHVTMCTAMDRMSRN